jgi:hypothetical protein
MVRFLAHRLDIVSSLSVIREVLIIKNVFDASEYASNQIQDGCELDFAWFGPQSITTLMSFFQTIVKHPMMFVFWSLR